MRTVAKLGPTITVLKMDGAFEAERTGVHLFVLLADFANLLVEQTFLQVLIYLWLSKNTRVNQVT